MAMNSSGIATSETVNATTDVSGSELSQSHQIAFICLWVVGLVLNSLCALLVGSVVWRRPSWPNSLLFVLTLTDVTVIVFGLSVGVAAVVDSSILWKVGKLCVYQSIVINTWYLYSYILVLGISLDRYLAVCHPFAYNQQMTHSTSLVKGIAVLVAAAVIMVLISCLPLILGASIAPVKPGLICFFDWTSHAAQNRVVAIVNVAIISLTVCVLLFFTAATCCGIYKMVQSARMRGGNVSLTRKAVSSAENDTEVKFAKLMVVIVILFAACNLPFLIVIIVQMSSQYHNSDAGYIALGALLLGTQLNPIVHSMVQRSVRRAFRNASRTVCAKMCCHSTQIERPAWF